MYKVCCVVVAIAMFLPLWVLCQPSPNSAVDTLAAMLGKSRPLLIFYPQYPGDRPLGKMVARQRNWIESHKQELQDRDVVTMYVPVPTDYEVLQSMDLWRELRSHFHVDGRKFTVMLLGKDGSEKFHSHEPVTIEKLDALIDAMPMRQQEVRDGQHAK